MNSIDQSSDNHCCLTEMLNHHFNNLYVRKQIYDSCGQVQAGQRFERQVSALVAPQVAPSRQCYVFL